MSCPDEAKLFVITGPTGPYFPVGMKAVNLLADPKYVRAWPGGCGNFKMGRYIFIPVGTIICGFRSDPRHLIRY